MQKKVVVVGAGAAGMMAAGTAAEFGASVTLLEKNPRVGRKIMITGKGRCNLCNNCDIPTFISNVPTNGRFLYSAIHHFSPGDTMAFFESLGLPLKTERGNRVFPASEKAADVVDTLRDYVTNSGVRIVNDTARALLTENGEAVGVKGERRQRDHLLRRKELSADRLDGRRLYAREAGRTYRDGAETVAGAAREQRPRVQVDAGLVAAECGAEYH